MTPRLGIAYRLAGAAIVAAAALVSLAGAQGLPGLKDFLERGYRIVSIVPDGNRHVIYLQQEVPSQGSLVMCFLTKNERGRLAYTGCDHVMTYDRPPAKR